MLGPVAVFSTHARGPRRAQYLTCPSLLQLLGAVAVFSTHARGPRRAQYLTQLEEECGRLWRHGRQLCEALSLTGNPCINPVHRLPGQPEDDEDLEHRWERLGRRGGT